MNVTDIIVLLAIFCFAFTGWRRGFLRSLNGPISLIICVALGALYFKKTQNVMLGLALTIIGPLALNIFLGLLLDILRKADHRLNVVSFLSRLAGMFVNLGWSGSMLLLSVFFLSIMPAQLFGMEALRENVLKSRTYSLMAKLILQPLSPSGGVPLPGQNPLDADFPDSGTRVTWEDSEEYKTLMSDPRIKAIFTDEATLNQIKQRDMARLLENKKILTILQDPALIKKFFNLYKKIQSFEQKPVVYQENLPS